MASYKAVIHHRTKKDGTRRVMIRITKSRKINYVATDIYLEEKLWNSKKGEVKQGHSLQEKWNIVIRKKIQELQENEANQIIEGNSPSAIEIKKITMEGPADFLSYFKQRVEILKETRSYDTWKRNDFSYIKLERYVKEVIRKEVISFRDFNSEFIEGYYSYLLNFNKPITANKELETLSGVWLSADRRKIIKNLINPFIDLKKKKVEDPFIERLEQKEVDILYYIPLTSHACKYRHMWLLQYYTAGMRVRDAILLKVPEPDTDRLEYRMSKTKKKRSFLITGRLKEIITLYSKGKKPGEYLFGAPKNKPILKMKYYNQELDEFKEKNSREPNDEELGKIKKWMDKRLLGKYVQSETSFINRTMKEIAATYSIKKTIKSKTARHSFGDRANKKTQNIFDLMELLGHSDVKITLKYVASLSNGEYDEMMDQIYTNNKELVESEISVIQ